MDRGFVRPRTVFGLGPRIRHGWLTGLEYRLCGDRHRIRFRHYQFVTSPRILILRCVGLSSDLVGDEALDHMRHFWKMGEP